LVALAVACLLATGVKNNAFPGQQKRRKNRRPGHGDGSAPHCKIEKDQKKITTNQKTT